MPMLREADEVKRLAGLELNDLTLTDTLPRSVFDGTRVASAGTPVYDINGEVLFRRVPVRRGRRLVGHTDLAVNPALGHVLLAAAADSDWSPRALRATAASVVAERHPRIRYSRMRFVAYSFPKLAIQFLARDREVLMLELYTWTPVPRAEADDPEDPNVNFRRRSVLDEIPTRRRAANVRRFDERLERWNEIAPARARGFDVRFVRAEEFARIPAIAAVGPFQLVARRELDFAARAGDHYTCYELRSQLTNVWCVAGSVQMVLDFYRYRYGQVRIAQELGLGTLASPNGLPYSRDADVVTVLENLTGNALHAQMTTSPKWSEFKSEITANRPLVSFIPQHSRTVAGYTEGPSVAGGNFRGLLVYDPWPPSPSSPPDPTTGGTIARWENFNASTYRRTFTAHLHLA